MKLTTLTPDAAAAVAVRSLGLGSVASLVSDEVIAASLRRAASFMCPTSPRRLVDAVLDSLNPLTPEPLTREDVADALDRLVSCGDLIELSPDTDQRRRLLYLGPPTFVERRPGEYLLTGIRPFGANLLDGDMGDQIEHLAHSRLIRLGDGTGRERLESAGLHPVNKERWVRSPAAITALEHLQSFESRLSVAPEAGAIDGLLLLDPTRPTRYYRGRWRGMDVKDSGIFLARRPRAYGADLWCLVRREEGQIRLLDLPVEDPIGLGSDEGWRYQAAVDAERGEPQFFRVMLGQSAHTTLLQFFSPLPRFAERYMALVGTPCVRSGGCIVSYSIPVAALDETASYLQAVLWLSRQDVDSET